MNELIVLVCNIKQHILYSVSVDFRNIIGKLEKYSLLNSKLNDIFVFYYQHKLEKKMKNLLILLTFIFLASCATKINFHQTCTTCTKSQRLFCEKAECPTSQIIQGRCVVSIIETGELIYIDEILKNEGIPAREGINFTIAKLNGRFILVGENFKNTWLITPHRKNIASIKGIQMPAQSMGIVFFELDNLNQLKMYSQDKTKSYIFDDNKDKWLEAKSARVGG